MLRFLDVIDYDKTYFMKAEGLDAPLHIATACQKETVFRKQKSLLVKYGR